MRHYAFIWACLLSLTGALAYQDGGAKDRIVLDVVANDQSGRPVVGLQQQDFSVFENKQQQKVLSFAAKSGAEAGTVTLVMDEVNTSFSRVAFEREQIKKFLQQDGGRLAQPISLAFFSDAGVKAMGQESRDGNALAAVVDQNVNGLRSIRPSQGFYGAAERMELSIRALDELIAAVAKKPGRKIIIWMSPGWPLLSGPRVELSQKDQQGIFRTVVATSRQLRESRIVLYSVDPLGTEEGLSRENYYRQFLKGLKKAKDAQFGDLGLQVLAYQSGGRVLNANNDLRAELEACVRDLEGYYVLEFAGIPAVGPDDYHAIEVKVGKAGVQAQTRSGYYAQVGSGQ